MFIQFLLSCLLCLLGSRASLADSPCVDWTDSIEDLLFEPLRKIIKDKNVTFYPLPDFTTAIGWASVTTSKGTVGDLTSFKLRKYAGVESALMCQIDTSEKSNLTVALTVGLDDLEIAFQNLGIKLPILPLIGGVPTLIKNSGNGISLSVSVRTTAQSDCLVDLNYLQIHDLGATFLEFDCGPWSIFDRIYQFLFNVLYNVGIWLLKVFGTVQTLEKEFAAIGDNLISQNKDQVCQILQTAL